MMRRGWTIALCGLLVSTPANASSTFEALLSAFSGTLSVMSVPNLVDGQLRGCTLVFDAVHQDWTYRAGAFLKVTGNVGFAAIGGGLAANLKVVVHEIDTTGHEARFNPSPPSRAYLIDEQLATNLNSLIKATESDTPGALFSVFQLSPTFEMVVAALETNKMTVAFNSRNGGTDMQLPLELDVVDVSETGERTRSEQPKQDFLNCLSKLASSLQ